MGFHETLIWEDDDKLRPVVDSLLAKLKDMNDGFGPAKDPAHLTGRVHSTLVAALGEAGFSLTDKEGENVLKQNKVGCFDECF